MGVTGSTQRLRPMVNPDGKVGLKVRVAIVSRPVRPRREENDPEDRRAIAHPARSPPRRRDAPADLAVPERPATFPRVDQQASDREAGRRTAEHQRVRDAPP